jgi:hypothetical protein
METPMRMLLTGLSEHLSMTLLDEGRGWHFGSWHSRKDAVAPAEPCAGARARIFPTVKAALGYFRQVSSAAPEDRRHLVSAVRAAAGYPAPQPAESRLPAESVPPGVTTDAHAVFAWIPTAVVAQALASSWNFGLAVAAIEGHGAGLQMRLLNGGVVYVLGDAASPHRAFPERDTSPRRLNPAPASATPPCLEAES